MLSIFFSPAQTETARYYINFIWTLSNDSRYRWTGWRSLSCEVLSLLSYTIMVYNSRIIYIYLKHLHFYINTITKIFIYRSKIYSILMVKCDLIYDDFCFSANSNVTDFCNINNINFSSWDADIHVGLIIKCFYIYYIMD